MRTQRPRLTGGRLPIAAAAVQLGGTFAASHQHGSRYGCWWASHCSAPSHADGLAALLLLLGPAALLLRRSHPRAVLAFVFAVTLGYAAAGYPQGPCYVSLVVAFVNAVIVGERVAAGLALVLGWATFLWVPAALGYSSAPSAGGAASLAAWMLVAFAAAEGLRGRGARIEQARRRRAELEQHRADEERLRIARELHDVLAHSISLINVQSGVALHLIDQQPEQARTALQAINEASADALREVRSVLGVLRGSGEEPPRAPTAGLSRLDELIAGAASAGVRAAVEVEGERRPLPASVDLAAFRIVQESLTNVVRHAGAGSARVRLAFGGDVLTVQVDDDGASASAASELDGDAARTRAEAAGLGSGSGIAGMRERAVAVGGSLEAAPRPGGGFRVLARLPLGGAG